MMIYFCAKDTKESPGALKISGVESVGRMLKRDVKLAHGNQPVAGKTGVGSSNLSAAQPYVGGIADDPGIRTVQNGYS